jgi:proprotein convertase subtilisin/kexin type 5
MTGYFESLVAVAAKCPPGCDVCESLTFCTGCSSGYFMLTNNLCASTCPIKYYGDSLARRCEACPYDCETCSVSAACLSCVSPAVLTAAGRCGLPAGSFWGTGATGRLLTAVATYVAQSCPSSCTSCLSATICLSCASGFFMRADLFCYSSCPARHYQDTATRMCVACPYDCETCSSTGQCLTCNSTTDFR